MKQTPNYLQGLINQIKKSSKKIGEKIKIKYLSLTMPKQVVLIGIILGLISLFLPWITDGEKELQTWNAFNSLSGNVGYILIFIFCILSFIILSSSYKQKVKLYSGVNISNHFLIIMFGLLAIILSIVVLSFAVGLGIVGQYINYGNGPIFCIISGIFIIAGGLYIRQDYKRNNSEIILEEMSKNRKEKKKKENMELPI